jgi:hypothetical protein
LVLKVTHIHGPFVLLTLKITLKKCVVRKKYFVLGRPEQPRHNKKNLLCWHDKPNEPTKKGHLLVVPLSPVHLSFNSQQGLPLSSLSFLGQPATQREERQREREKEKKKKMWATGCVC